MEKPKFFFTEAEWKALTEDERQKILARDFYKNLELLKVPGWVKEKLLEE